MKSKKLITRVIGVAAAALMCASVGLMGACKKETSTNASSIKSVTAIGSVEYDGVKLKAIAVEYEQDLAGAVVSADTYEIGIYTTITCAEKGNGEIGDITAVYVNNEVAVSENGGTDSGNYVIIEVFSDYTATTSLTYTNTMAAKVTQVQDIVCGDGTVISASTKTVGNNIGNKAKTYNFVIPDIEGFKYYTNNTSEYPADGPAYSVKNCFSMQDGLYHDVDLSYALYLPEGWHEGGNYAMVTLQNPAAASNTHPMTSVLAFRSAAVYASEWAQNVVTEAHPEVEGLIVLVPVLTERVNDNGGTPAEYEAVVSLWDYIIANYGVDENYIYGSGQSVGGMIVLETNRNRDNFFAGILLYDDQWGQNYYVDTIFERDMVSTPTVAEMASMHYPRTDGNITWDYYLDTDGNKVYEDHDPYNYYYLISDDNIMITNSTMGGLSNDNWREMKYLYKDLVNVDFNQCIVDGSLPLDEQNEIIRNWTDNMGDPLNINWISFEGGSTSRKLDATYEWLLSQSRETAIARPKLDLNKPFAIADEEDRITEGRELYFVDINNDPIYFLTGKAGAGTQFYNSYWGNTRTIADAMPGWLPEGMSWEKGVSASSIVGVTQISSTAVAIEYSTDMTGIVINLKGEKVYNYLTGQYRDNDFIALDPYEFVDAQGNTVACTIKTVYVNDTPATADLALREGSGCYVIVEFTEPVNGTIAGVIQRTTVRTDLVIANASHLIRGLGSEN